MCGRFASTTPPDAIARLLQPDWPLWLGETEGDPRALLHPSEPGTLKTWPVGTRINRPANNDAGLLEPAGL